MFKLIINQKKVIKLFFKPNTESDFIFSALNVIIQKNLHHSLTHHLSLCKNLPLSAIYEPFFCEIAFPATTTPTTISYKFILYSACITRQSSIKYHLSFVLYINNFRKINSKLNFYYFIAHSHCMKTYYKINTRDTIYLWYTQLHFTR